LYIKSSCNLSVQHAQKKSGAVALALILAMIFSINGAKVFAVGRAGEELPTPASLIEPQKVVFPSEDAELTGGKPTMLEGYLFRPEGPGPFPAIVGLHGCSGLFTADLINARYTDWGGRLAALGYVVFFPDSFGPRGNTEVCRQKDRSSFSPHRERPRDAVGALRWLQKQAIVQRERVGLMGWSNGGTTLLSTIGALSKKAGSDGFQVAIAFYPGCTKFVHKKNWQPRIPLTIFIGEADDWTPAAPCKELVARANTQGCQADIITFPTAYHGFDHPNLPQTIRKGLAFTVNGQGSAQVGTDPEGRATVLELVPTLLARYL
jgi:dienelactone hydrolase